MRNLDQAGFNGVCQREIADHPRERPIAVLTDTAEEIWRCGQIHAEVDAAQFVNPIEPLDPYRGFFVEVIDLVALAEQVPFVGVRLFTPDSVRVMRLVVEDQDILLPADFFQDALDQGRIAFDITLGLDDHAREVAVTVLLAINHRQDPCVELSIEFLLGQVAPAASSRCLLPNGDELARPHFHAGLDDLRRHSAALCPVGLEVVPVGDQHSALLQIAQLRFGHEIARAIETAVAEPRVNFLEAAADRDIRTDDEDDVRVARVGSIVDLVQDAPRREQAHHRGLS